MTSRNTYGTWRGTFSASEDDGTEVTFVEDVSTNNLLMKLFLKHFLMKHQETYIRDLKNKLGE